MYKRPLRFLASLAALCFLLCMPAAQGCGEGVSASPQPDMAALAFRAQKDEPIASLPYSGFRIGVAGCAPVSIVNALVSVFGVTDPAVADAMVGETLLVLSNGQSYKKSAINAGWFNRLLDKEMLAKESGGSPALSALMDAYSGQLVLSASGVDAGQIAETAISLKENAILTGRINVREGWQDLLSLMHSLHDAGMDDARIALAFAGVGRVSSGTPLRSGKSGHYLALTIPVGAFFESGEIYVLDSMPRALAGEDYGKDKPFTALYPFLEDSPSNAFNTNFAAERVSRPVIRLFLTDGALSSAHACPGAGDACTHAQLLKPLVLFGSCLLFLSI